MKNPLLFLIVITLCIACQKDENIGPRDLLYQRWHLERAKRVGDSAWFSYDTDGFYDTEYRPDGTLVYRKDGAIIQAGCCSPTQFDRTETIINYKGWRTCPQVRCKLTTNATITRVSDDLLELSDDIYITQYNSVK